MDLALVYDSLALDFDLALQGGDLATDSGLRSAVLVSLFTDRRAEADDPLPGAPGDTDRRGWWADAWPAVDGDRIGSRLWLLARQKQTVDVLLRAQSYSEEALAWLIDDGVARSVQVEAQWVRPGMLGLRVVITLADGVRFEDVFNYHFTGA